MGAWPGLPPDPQSALRGAGLTCDVLTPGVVQVRGQHVPHGEEEPRGPITAAACRCLRCSDGPPLAYGAGRPAPAALAAASARLALRLR